MMKATLSNLMLWMVIFGVGSVVTACKNTGTSGVGAGGSSSTTSPGARPSGAPSSSTNGPSFTLSNITVTAASPTPSPQASPAAAPQSQAPAFTLIFSALSQNTTLRDVCQVQGSGSNTDPAKSCKCRFAWDETNTSDSSVIRRVVETEPTQVTTFNVECPGPDVWDTEIADGVVLRIRLVPNTARGNNTGFTTNELGFTKAPITSTGDFRDSEGRSFRNIFHYVCYDKFQKNLTISHLVVQRPSPLQNRPSNFVSIANEFSLGGGTGPTSFSAQSYYYDFYVRSNETGSINAGNASFTCPQVNVNGSPSFYPMDSTFALALQSNRDFSIPVAAQTVIPIASAGQNNQPGNILGYAARPLADGTCPIFTDSSGRILQTFRLRQYTALYPIRFDADGSIKDRSQPFNQVYVLDRPVNGGGQPSQRPITRLGPKPCPFSFRTAQFGQRCSTDAALAGWNIDGTQISGNSGCPIYPPVPNQYLRNDGTLVIRPFRPFLPHYLENTSFRACAFRSSTPVDPEIILSHDDTVNPTATGPNDFYCARHYPAVGSILQPPGGDPFDKAPGSCDLAAEAAAIKTNRTYACSRSYNPTSSALNTPAAGCCQICSGPNCVPQGGGITPAGRNAAFNPPRDNPPGNPAQSIRALPRAIPNQAGGGGCFDPTEP
ncbi:MAG: hypothetical protein AB1540_05775 [Bdellovibrionota bacterium]